jgi:GNAT superfamily N-acetyltransferase
MSDADSDLLGGEDLTTREGKVTGKMTIRPFVPGQDDSAWVGINNRALAAAPDFVALTVEELQRGRQIPWYKYSHRFVAELDGIVVGTVSAFLKDDERMRVGYVGGPNVVPEARRQRVGTALMERAIEALRERGATGAEGGAGDWNVAAHAFLRKYGFEPAHTHSRMERDLAPVSGIGENRDVILQPFGLSDGEVATWHRLIQAAFAEYHNFERSTLDEWTQFARHQGDDGGVFERYFAVADGEPVGFLTIEIDRRENEQLGKKRGWVNDIGVLKEHRGRGIATRLLIHTIDRLRALGMDTAVLSVDDQNVTGARRVYERAGFRLVRRYTSFERLLPPPR